MNGKGLTEEQKRRIEENKKLAIARRIEKLSPVKAVTQTVTSVTTSQPSLTNVRSNNDHYNRHQLLSTNNNSSIIHSSIHGATHVMNSSNTTKNKNYKWQANTNSSTLQLQVPASQNLTTSKEQLPKNTEPKSNGKCVFVGNGRFIVEIGYNAPLVQYFKQFRTRNYDATTKLWSFEMVEYYTLIKGVRSFRPDIEIEGLPLWILQIFGQDYNDGDVVPSADLSHVDEKLVQTLLPFQREGVNCAIYHNGRLLIADDMGLGKTLQAICIACYYRTEWPLLIVSPSSVRFDWAQQICKWLPSVAPCDINVVETGKASATSGVINIVSYDLLSKKSEELKKKKFRVIIMDESHFLKNTKTVRTTAAMPLLKNAKRVLLLSGTPALSRPNELFSQITAIFPNLFKFHDFGVRYCNAKKREWGWDYSSSSNMMELQALLEKKIMIRRQKKDVLSQLPDKYRQVIMLDPHSVLKHSDLKVASEHLNNNKLKGLSKRGALLEYFHETSKAKLTAVRDYVLDLIEGEKKILMFAHHKEMLDCVEDAIKSKTKNIQYIRIDGRTSSEQRNFFCGQFQTCDNYRLAILSITAANAGLNLSAANIVVFAELFWNPGILVQAEDRAHRIGQKDSVSVQYLVAQHTADDYIWPLVQSKLDILSKAGLAKDDFGDTDTKRLSDNTQQSILDMFSTEFIDNTVPDMMTEDKKVTLNISVNVEGLSPEKLDINVVSSSQLSVKSNVVADETKRSSSQKTPRKSAATDWTRKVLTKHEMSTQSGSTQGQMTPSKRQASITSFFERTPPKKKSRLDDESHLAMQQAGCLKSITGKNPGYYDKVNVATQDSEDDYCTDMPWLDDEFTIPGLDNDANIRSALTRSDELDNKVSQESKTGGDKSPFMTSQESNICGDRSPCMTSQESNTVGDISPCMTSQESKTEDDRSACVTSHESTRGSNTSTVSQSGLLWLQDLDWDDEI